MRAHSALLALACSAGLLRGEAAPASRTTAQLEVIPTNVVCGATVLIHVTVTNEQGIDDWYCVPRLGERLLHDLRFGDLWTRGFERPTSVNRFYERKLEAAGEYDFFVTAWDAQRNPRESNHVKVRVNAKPKPPAKPR